MFNLERELGRGKTKVERESKKQEKKGKWKLSLHKQGGEEDLKGGKEMEKRKDQDIYIQVQIPCDECDYHVYLNGTNKFI